MVEDQAQTYKSLLGTNHHCQHKWYPVVKEPHVRFSPVGQCKILHKRWGWVDESTAVTVPAVYMPWKRREYFVGFVCAGCGYLKPLKEGEAFPSVSFEEGVRRIREGKLEWQLSTKADS